MPLARWIYALLLYLGAPCIWLRLLWRAWRQPEYLAHLRERWGFYDAPSPAQPLLWLHAVSVGETRAAEPLIHALLAAYPGHQLLLTCMTPTGRATGQSLYAAEPRLLQAYLPYDYPGAMARFLDHYRPQLGVIMETEIWPQLLGAAHQRQLPVVLANARLSARSARGYGRIGALVRPALSQLAAVAAQTEADANRLALLGARNIRVCGNLKFDVTPEPELLAQGARWRATLSQGATRPIWLAASTRAGEEALILDQLQRLNRPALLLVLVPRHPQRFDEVARLVQARGLNLKRRSEGLPEPRTQVWLGDSMGEMAAYYRLADLAFVGGSLLPLGGQNLIEAAACACPVLVGAHTFNFAQASADAVAAGAAVQVADAQELGTQVAALLDDAPRRASMTKAALEFASTHRGAVARTLALITATMR